MVLIVCGIALYVIESLGAAPYEVEHAKKQNTDTLAIGICLMLLNMTLAIFERLYQRRLLAITPVDISKTGMMLLNNAFATPFVVLMIFPMGEYKWEKLHRWGVEGEHHSEWYHY